MHNFCKGELKINFEYVSLLCFLMLWLIINKGIIHFYTIWHK